MKNIRKEVKKLAQYSTILIVDDSKVSLEMYKIMLNELFSKVYTACNGEEAYHLWIKKYRYYFNRYDYAYYERKSTS